MFVPLFLPSFLPSFFHSFIHSFLYLCLEFSLAPSQTELSTVSSFSFQYPVISFRSSCRRLRLLLYLSFTSNLPSFFQCNIMFYKTVPKRDVTNQISLPSIYCKYAITFLLDCKQYFFISHTTEQTELHRASPAPQFNTLQLFMICFLQCAVFSIIQITCCKCSSLLVTYKKSPICC